MASENVPADNGIVTIDATQPGEKCENGHFLRRRTPGGRCPVCWATRKTNQVDLRARAQAWASRPENRAKKNARTAQRYKEIKATDPEKLRAKWRADRARDPKAAVARNVKWQRTKVEELKAYRRVNKAKLDQRGKEWAKANPERVRANTRKWQLAHPEAAGAWRKANPAAARAIKNTRRARDRNAEGKHTAAEIKELFAKQKGRCIYCKSRLGKSFHADHIQALAAGGTNWIANIQLLCRSCNCRKWATDSTEFAQRIGLLL